MAISSSALRILAPHSPNTSLTEATNPNTAAAWDIAAPKWVFPHSFDTISIMPRTYIINTDPSIPPVLHATRKVPIKYHDQIEKTFDNMVALGVIAPVTWPTKWISSLTYPHKTNGSLHICLDTKDLKKAISWQHYKALTLSEISHCLSGATCFSKLDAKDCFWSINLNEKSSYLTTFNVSICSEEGIASSTCPPASRCHKIFSRCIWIK